MLFRSTTGLNDAFVVNGADKADLIKGHSRADSLFVPYMGGRNVDRWAIHDSDRWLIKIESSANVNHPWSAMSNVDAEKCFKEIYPSIFEWFSRPDISQKLKDRDDQGKFYWELRSCTYWEKFFKPKVISTKISSQPTFAVDTEGYTLANTSYFFQTDRPHFCAAVLNSTVGDYLARQTFASKQGGFYEVQPAALEKFPIPEASPAQIGLIDTAVLAIMSGGSAPRLESLLNAFVYELFFPEDLSERGLSPFAAAQEAGLDKLAGLKGEALARAADDWSRQLADPSTQLYATLFDLQSIDAIRIIEGRA